MFWRSYYTNWDLKFDLPDSIPFIRLMHKLLSSQSLWPLSGTRNQKKKLESTLTRLFSEVRYLHDVSTHWSLHACLLLYPLFFLHLTPLTYSKTESYLYGEGKYTWSEEKEESIAIEVEVRWSTPLTPCWVEIKNTKTLKSQ